MDIFSLISVWIDGIYFVDKCSSFLVKIDLMSSSRLIKLLTINEGHKFSFMHATRSNRLQKGEYILNLLPVFFYSLLLIIRHFLIPLFFFSEMFI